MNEYKLEKWGSRVLRYGLAIVFFWFGINQLLNPADWVSFVPEFAVMPFASAMQLVLINGLFEVIAAFLLVVKVFPRIAALLLSLHLFGITASIGINSIGVRDFGLAVATLALALLPQK